MKKYKVICLDMFQTLVCISDRKEYIWKRILREDYTQELCEKYSSLTSKRIVNNFHEIHSISDEFLPLRNIFKTAFTEMFNQENLNRSPIEAAEIFIEEHNNANWYVDSLKFLEALKKKYKVCIVTDADMDMIQNHLNEINIDKAVISEEVKSYKRNDNGLMFKEVLRYFNCSPDEVLHIGDSSSDMYGARKINIDTCWINRHNYSKSFDFLATYEIENLNELNEVLQLNVVINE